MLNIFPSFLDFNILSPSILRLFLGLIFIYLGTKDFKKNGGNLPHTLKHGFKNASVISVSIGLTEIVSGVLITIGLFTQIDSLVLTILTAIMSVSGMTKKPLGRESVVFYLLAFAVSLSLLLSGAGALAFDLPL